MFARMMLGCLLGLGVAVGSLAADKKAEGDLRWALNYCGKVVKDMETKLGKEMTATTLAGVLKRWQSDHAKFIDYLGKATAKDASVTTSNTVYDTKTGQTYAQAYQRCLKVEGEMQAFQKQLGQKKAADQEKRDVAAREQAAADAKQKAMEMDKVAAHQARKEAESKQWTADENKRVAMEAATSAILGTCSGFKGRAGSSGVEDNLKFYDNHKKKALSTYADVVKESMTVELRASSDAPGTNTTKTVGEWFKYCDEMMPAHVAAIRKKETDYAAKDQADSAARKAANDRIRKEQAAQFKALVAATDGDRRKILESKGFVPWWPRSGDLKTAPIWKWQISITHQPTRCETFQFQENKLAKNFSELGSCP